MKTTTLSSFLAIIISSATLTACTDQKVSHPADDAGTSQPPAESHRQKTVTVKEADGTTTETYVSGYRTERVIVGRSTESYIAGYRRERVRTGFKDERYIAGYESERVLTGYKWQRVVVGQRTVKTRVWDGHCWHTVVRQVPVYESRRVPVYATKRNPVWQTRRVPTYEVRQVPVIGYRVVPRYEERKTPIHATRQVPRMVEKTYTASWSDDLDCYVYFDGQGQLHKVQE